MSTRPDDGLWPDPKFGENNERFPVEELWRHIGQHVAWSRDGTHLLAGAGSLDELFRKLDEAGIDLRHVVLDYVDDPAKGYLR